MAWKKPLARQQVFSMKWFFTYFWSSLWIWTNQGYKLTCSNRWTNSAALPSLTLIRMMLVCKPEGSDVTKELLDSEIPKNMKWKISTFVMKVEQKYWAKFYYLQFLVLLCWSFKSSCFEKKDVFCSNLPLFKKIAV